MTYTLHHGDCLDILRTMPDNSVDAVVTDPPYGLSFMGKRWDYDVPSVDIWAECLRVLKPGGHLLAFAGTRTQHRMAVRIEDAGFEIRDMIAWVYGSGFPKSMDVSKAIDKGHGENRERQLQFTAWMRSTGITAEQINEATSSCMASHYLTDKSQPAIATADMFDKLRPYLPEVPEYIERLVCERTGLEWTAYKQREVVGQKIVNGEEGTAGGYQNGIASVRGSDVTIKREVDITAPATDAAKQWHGWGTALKPALEPITVARKPLIGTVAENVLTWGTGGVNVDGCRVAVRDDDKGGWRPNCYDKDYQYENNGDFLADVANGSVGKQHPEGRWPANLIHDGSEEVVELFPETGPARTGKNQRCFKGWNKVGEIGDRQVEHHNDSGSAARFFYCAKASKRDRDEGCEGMPVRKAIVTTMQADQGMPMRIENGVATGPKAPPSMARNHHPTVKPTDLMRYLCRLVTPPDGVVLDPFMGSGSTGKAAMLEDFNFIGIEREAEYLDIARARIEHAINNKPNKLL